MRIYIDTVIFIDILIDLQIYSERKKKVVISTPSLLSF